MYIRKIIEDTHMQVVMKHSKSHIKKRLRAQITKSIAVLFLRRVILNQNYSPFSNFYCSKVNRFESKIYIKVVL